MARRPLFSPSLSPFAKRDSDFCTPLFPFSFPSSQREERRESLLSAFSPGRTPSLSSSSFSLFPDATRGDLDKKSAVRMLGRSPSFQVGARFNRLCKIHIFSPLCLYLIFLAILLLSLSVSFLRISQGRERMSLLLLGLTNLSTATLPPLRLRT